MLLALIFRGVAFEFRFKSRRNRHWWDRAFACGSMAATFAQGVVLGAFIHGHRGRRPRLCRAGPGLAQPVLPVLRPGADGRLRHAGRRLADRQDRGRLQSWAYGRCASSGLLTLAAVAVVSLWTPLIHAEIAARWFAWPNIALSRRPCRSWSSLAVMAALHRASSAASTGRPFLLTLAPVHPLLRRPRDQPVPLRHPARRSRSGTRPRPAPRRCSCWSAPCSCCRSSWPTPATTTGCSAGR